MNLTIEQMRKIVDGAPEWAGSFNVYLAAYGSGGTSCKGDVFLNDLKSQIDHHYYGRSEEEELEAYAELSQEKIEGGAILVGNFSEAKKKIQSVFEDDRTDHVSDIRNHIAPTTVVLDVHVNEALRLNRLG